MNDAIHINVEVVNFIAEGIGPSWIRQFSSLGVVLFIFRHILKNFGVFSAQPTSIGGDAHFKRVTTLLGHFGSE